jgi:cell division protein ZapD
VILYEFPLNERIRTLLRLEDLYDSVRYFKDQPTRADHHACIAGMFDILDIASRGDLKSELLQELDRQKSFLMSLKDNPAIAADKWRAVMAENESAFANLHASSGKTGQEIRDNEWLMAIKQRLGIPGGVCEFDLPSYHFWMHKDTRSRQADIQRWLKPLQPLAEGLSVVLRVLRESGRAGSYVAIQGTFQQAPMERPAQLLRLALEDSYACVPELSANKYALNIRFLLPGGGTKTRVFESNVNFELAYCNL